VVLLNSRQGHFSATPSGSTISITLPGRSFSRSYGAILPSSLTRVLPIPLVFSTRLPVSVCGTGARISLEAFLGSMGSTTCGPMGTAITSQDQATDFPIAIISLQAWHLPCPFRQAGLPFCVTPSLKQSNAVPEY
jgi:hypothetical protein